MQKGERVKFTTNIDEELLKKIKVRAIKEGKNVNEIIEELFEEYLKRWSWPASNDFLLLPERPLTLVMRSSNICNKNIIFLKKTYENALTLYILDVIIKLRKANWTQMEVIVYV